MPGQPDYAEKKSRFDRMLTVYGRKAVLEALRNESLDCHALHLARSNREEGIISEIRLYAESRGIPVRLHTREALARISRNGRQDQGVALDIQCPSFRHVKDFLAAPADMPRRILALDGVTTVPPAATIVRAACASASANGSITGPAVIKPSRALSRPAVCSSGRGQAALRGTCTR